MFNGLYLVYTWYILPIGWLYTAYYPLRPNLKHLLKFWGNPTTATRLIALRLEERGVCLNLAGGWTNPIETYELVKMGSS